MKVSTIANSKVIPKDTYPQNSAIQDETLALSVHDVAVLHALILGHESGLMQVGVELLGLAILLLLARVKSLQAVLAQGAHQDVLSHLQAGNEIQEVLVLRRLGCIDLVFRDGEESAVEVVNALQEIDSKALNGEDTRILHVSLSSLLEVEEIRYRADIFILIETINSVHKWRTRSRTVSNMFECKVIEA